MLLIFWLGVLQERSESERTGRYLPSGDKNEALEPPANETDSNEKNG